MSVDRKASAAWLIMAVAILGVVAGVSSSCGSGGDARRFDKTDQAESTAADSLRVLIVHSYDNDFRWTRDQGRGIADGLREAGLNQAADYEIRTLHMDTRIRYTSADQIMSRAAEALTVIRDWKPDIVFVTDDAALQYVAVAYVEQNHDQAIPFVFSGVNGDPTLFAPIKSLDAPGSLITGALERIPFTDAFATVARVYPAAKRVVVLGDSSSSSAAVRDSFQQQYHPGSPSSIEVLDFKLIDTFSEWQQNVERLQNDVDVIAILNYHRLKDDAGNNVPAQDVMTWTLENSRIPELGLVADWTQDGLFMAVGNSGYATGLYVGKLGAEILNGRRPGSIPIIDPHEVEVTYNLNRARSLGISITSDELGKAANVVGQ